MFRTPLHGRGGVSEERGFRPFVRFAGTIEKARVEQEGVRAKRC